MKHARIEDGGTVSKASRKTGIIRKILHVDIWSVLCSFILTSFLFAGYSFQQSGDLSFFLSDKSHLVLGGIAFILIVFVLSVLFGFLFDKMAQWRDSLKPRSLAWNRRTILIAFATMSIAWFVVLLVHFPGTITYDTYMQMMQMYGLADFSNHHPFFDTCVYSLFFHLGDLLGNRGLGVFLHGIFQIGLTAFALSLVIDTLRKLGVSRKVQIGCTVFLAVFPPIALGSICMTKDYLFAPFYIFFLVLFFHAVVSDGESWKSPKFCIAFAICSIFMILTKSPGLYIFAICAIALVIKNRMWLRALISCVVPFVISVFLVQGLVFSSLGVIPGSKGEALGMLFQQTARYVFNYEDEVSVEEADAIRAVIDYDNLSSLYTPILSDPVKFTYKTNSTLGENIGYLKTWFGQFLKHPGSYFAATFNTIFSFLYPSLPMDQFNVIPQDWQEDKVVGYLQDVSKTGTSLQQIRDVISEVVSPWNEPFTTLRYHYWNIYENISRLPVISFFFSEAFFGTWILAWVFFYLIRTRSKRGMHAFIPSVVSWLILIISPTMQVRYVTPLCYSCLMVLALCLIKPTMSEVCSRKSSQYKARRGRSDDASQTVRIQRSEKG